MKLKQYLLLLAVSIFVVGAAFIAKSGYYYAKGIVAQVLLNHAWETTKKTGEPTKAWRWADTVPIGRIKIPSIKMNRTILQNANTESLAFGPAHVAKTAMPGKNGNIVLAGHRDNFFTQLEFVSLKDSIIIESKENEKTYFIDEIKIVNPTEVKWLDSTSDNCVTLITCYPFDFLGDAPKRFIVRAFEN